MPHNYSPPVQPPWQTYPPELFDYDLSQPNSWDTHFNNLLRTGSFDPTTSFPSFASNLPHPTSTSRPNVPHFTSTYNVPHPTSVSNVPHVPLDSAQNLGLAHLPFHKDQPLLDLVPPTAPPAMLDSSGQYLSTNQVCRVWPTTCSLCSARPTSRPVRFQVDHGRSAFAGRDAMRPSAALPLRSSSRANPAASLHAMPSIRSGQPQFSGVVNAGSGSRDLSAARGGSARPSSRSGWVPSVRSARRARARPLVRVEDRIEWVRHDLMKMTLLFNWSPQAEAEAHEPWG